MATYVYKCKNKNCRNFLVEKTVNMPMNEYSEDKLPKCDVCNQATARIFKPCGIKTFGDGYKS